MKICNCLSLVQQATKLRPAVIAFTLTPRGRFIVQSELGYSALWGLNIILASSRALPSLANMPPCKSRQQFWRWWPCDDCACFRCQCSYTTSSWFLKIWPPNTPIQQLWADKYFLEASQTVVKKGLVQETYGLLCLNTRKHWGNAFTVQSAAILPVIFCPSMNNSGQTEFCYAKEMSLDRSQAGSPSLLKSLLWSCGSPGMEQFFYCWQLYHETQSQGWRCLHLLSGWSRLSSCRPAIFSHLPLHYQNLFSECLARFVRIGKINQAGRYKCGLKPAYQKRELVTGMSNAYACNIFNLSDNFSCKASLYRAADWPQLPLLILSHDNSLNATKSDLLRLSDTMSISQPYGLGLHNNLYLSMWAMLGK